MVSNGVLLSFFTLFLAINCFAQDVSWSQKSTFWNDLKTKVRARSFHEFMSPSAASPSVPASDGADLSPSNLYGFFWLDYEVFKNWRILYHQRELLEFSGAPTSLGIGGRFFDPRFGIRRSQVFDIPGLVTNYDWFIQPGITADAASSGKQFETGIRTNTNYTVPKSRWSVGMISELVAGFYDRGGMGSDFYGFFSPWVNYNLSATVSTQHWILIPFQHRSGDSWSQFSWDMPTNGPVIQNGIGVDVTDSIWISGLVNNYLNSEPTLKNTWLSIWVSVSFI